MPLLCSVKIHRANYDLILKTLAAYPAKLVAVSKTQPIESIREMYVLGQREFGENYVQEMTEKYSVLPKDINWHFIGHLQSNKVKYIAPYCGLIHGIDSGRILKEVNKQARKNERLQDCLLQIHIAKEESKFGFSFDEAKNLLLGNELKALESVRVLGFMGMASNTDDPQKIRKEFESLRMFKESVQKATLPSNCKLEELSMGMSGDYQIALDEGSTLVRIGTALFGERNYPTV